MKKIILSAIMLPVLANAAEISDSFEKQIWKYWNKPQFKYTYKNIADDGRNAKGAAAIIAKPGNPAKNDGNFFKEFPIEKNTDYRASVYVKTKDVNPEAVVSFAAQSMGQKMEFQARLAEVKFVPGSDWQKMEIQFKSIHVSANARIFLSAINLQKGSIIFDDFEFGKIESFSDCTDNFNTMAWGNWNVSQAKVKYSINPAVGRKAPGAAMMTFLAGHPAGHSGSFTRRLPVEPGKEYTFIVFVKNDGLTPAAKISMGIQALNAKNLFLGFAPRSVSTAASACEDWKRLVINFKVPTTGKWAQCRKMLVTLSASGSVHGSALFDDFEFFEAEKEEE